MPEERRQGNSELLEAFREFKQDIKEEIKEIKDAIKDIKDEQKDIDAKIMSKVQNHMDVNNKFYFNGFQPDKHVADHHVIDSIIEKVNEGKNLKSKVIEEVLKYIAIAAITWIGYASWDKFNAEIKPPIDTKPKVEQNEKISK